MKNWALPNYKSFSEKGKFFSIIKIETKQELLELFITYGNTTGLIFRGVNDASYKMLSSFHRFLITNNIDTILGMREILYPLCQKIAQIEGVIALFIKSQAFEGDFNSDAYVHDGLACHEEGVLDIKFGYFLLSLLQHYAGFSTLVDITSDFKTAIFFAVKDAKEHVESNINKYVSLYIIDPKYITNTNALSKYHSGIGTNLNYYKEYLMSASLDWLALREHWRMNSYFLEAIERLSNGSYLINENFVAQSGGFITYHHYIFEGAESGYFGITRQENIKRYQNPIKCFEINKKLLHDIENNLSPDFQHKLFPSKHSLLQRKVKNIYQAQIQLKFNYFPTSTT